MSAGQLLLVLALVATTAVSPLGFPWNLPLVILAGCMAGRLVGERS